MGPRPFGRGRLANNRRSSLDAQLQWGRDLSVAEGPQSRQPISIASASFNGAATFRSRKVGQFRHAPHDYGPASMGPRPFGRGRRGAWRAATPPIWLQWGRDLSVAEGRPHAVGQVPLYQLQWGRDLSVAEGLSHNCEVCGRVFASMGPRPFGRGRTSARSSRPPRPCGFNGAATFRSRKEIGVDADRR